MNQLPFGKIFIAEDSERKKRFRFFPSGAGNTGKTFIKNIHNREFL
jgi:hypothetical protein